MLWQLLLLGIALGTNNALASIALGTSNMPRMRQFRIAVIFGLFEALMPVIGIVLGESIAGAIGSKAKWIGIFILLATGIYLLLKKDNETSGEEAKNASGMRTLLLAVALSLDNLSAGFGLGFESPPIGEAALIFGVVSLIMALVGLEVGRFLGNRVSLDADKLSGVVLLVVAGFMFLSR